MRRMMLICVLLVMPIICSAQFIQTQPIDIPAGYAPGTTDSREMIRFTPPNDHAPFQFYHRTTIFGNDITNSVGWGFTPAGDVQGAPSLVFLMEDSFGTPPNAQFELHLQLAPLDLAPAVLRPWTWTFDRKTGRATVNTKATTAFYDGSNSLQLSAAAGLFSIGPTRHQTNSFIFETLSNGGATAKQIRIVPHTFDPGLSRLMFGDSNGIGLAKVGNDLEVLRAGTPATISAGPYKVNGTKVVGTQCLAIANTNGTQADNTRAINAALACMRSHGLLAP